MADIDVYVPPHRATDVVCFLLKAGYYEVNESDKDYGPFMSKNRIETRRLFDHDGHQRVDLLCLEHGALLRDVVSNFDLTFCEVWYDGHSLHSACKDDVLMMHGGLKPASSESGSMSRASASSASRRLSSETEEMASTSISVPCSRMSPRKPNVMQSAPASSSANASWPVWNRPPPRPRSLRRSHRQRAKATISMQSEPAMTAVSGRMNRSCLCSCCAWVWLGSARLRPFPAFVGSDGTGGGNDGGGEYGGQGGECGGAGGGDDAGGGRGGSGGKGGGGGEMARCVWIAKLKAAPARRAPYDRRKKNVAPPQWQSKFSPRPLGGPLSTETARASRGLSAHDHGRTAR